MNDYEFPREQQRMAASGSEQMLAIASAMCAVALFALLAIGMIETWVRPPM